MTDADRRRIRADQDRLIALVEARGDDEQLPITTDAGAPTVRQLRLAIFPEWHAATMRVAAQLEAEGSK